MESSNESKKILHAVRGFYSEAIAQEYRIVDQNPLQLPPAHKRAKIIWQAKTERYAPVLTEISKPKRPRFLEPVERWNILDDDLQIAVHADSYKPKVQLSYNVAPGKLRRGVEIERKQREYEKYRIQELLSEYGILPAEMVPPDIMNEILEDDEKYSLHGLASYLPLELFDNEDMDPRLPEEWMDIGLLDGVRHPVPALAFVQKVDVPFNFLEEMDIPLNELYDWVEVVVTDYDPEEKEYKIIRVDGVQQTLYVPRIYLMFKAENPVNFAKRVVDALARRQATENRIKYEFFVDNMVFPGVPDVSEDSLTHIYDIVTRKGQLKMEEHFVERTSRELSYMYRRAMNSHSFENTLKNSPEVFSFVKVPDKDPEKVPDKGRIATGMTDFNKTKKFMHWFSLYVIQEAYDAMYLVAEECDKVAAMNLYTLNYGKFVPLEEFETAQIQNTLNVIKHLKGPWLENITHNIRMCLRDVGKGCYNLIVKNYDLYAVSKLYRMMMVTLHRMQGALRTMVTNSLNVYTNLIETPCLCTLDCEEDFVWGNNLINTQFQPAVLPIFMLLLQMNESTVFYSTNPYQFEKTLIQLFDNPIVQSHGVKQVHPFLLENLRFADDLFLSSIGLIDPAVCEMRERIRIGIQSAIIPLIAYSKEYYRHIELWKLNVVDYVKNFDEEDHPALEVKDEISYQYKMKVNLEITLPERIIIGPFVINVEPLKLFLVNKRQDLYQKLLEMYATRMRNLVLAVNDEYKEIMRKLQEKPSSIEHILEIREWIETIPVSVRQQEELMRIYVLEYDVLEYFWYALTNDDFEQKWETIGLPYRIVQMIEDTNVFLDEETEKFERIQITDEYELIEKIDKMSQQVQALTILCDISKIHDTAVDVRRLWKAMKEAQERGLLLNTRQRLFGMPIVPFDNLNKLIKEFEPYRNLWITASDWLNWYDMWVDNPLVNIDADAMERNVAESYKTMVKLIRTFADFPLVQKVAIEVKQQIEDFRPKVPLILCLRNPGMKERHWAQIVEETGIEIVFSPNLTFAQCLEKGIDKYTEQINKIGEGASKEYAIEEVLIKMKGDWDNVLLDVQPYKNTGTYIMKISDEALQMLDDHTALTMQISYSPFRAALEKEINEWEEGLRLTNEVLESWTECQKTWMYLEPIFTSEDINRQLPAESKKYNTMERNWRRIMKSALETPKVMEMCPDKALLENLKECNAFLDIVQKGLAEYLETKRSLFPRFYFLSDDELLEILAQAKNPLAVQPHLRKCFENVAKLNFEADLQITAMYSSEGECVFLNPFIYPKGNVEDWLLKVEDTMKNTVRTTIEDALEDIEDKPRTEWVLRWPGQIVIVGSQTTWTAGVENGLQTHTLEEFYHSMLDMLDGLRGLVKGKLKKVERQVLSALIVIEVHARDVTFKLVKENVVNSNDFEWISQLRYYWVDDAELKVRAVNAEFPYGYEYLGNSGRLVITPLTDRCYLTLTGALHLKFGGAPAGPAGTGKTETTKDLAKAFGIKCVVFNCSDQLDFMAMGKFFKGLASSGSWACFDEFNRIDIEVLSVVAQQITTIQKAQMARLDRFQFEGTEIALKESCAVFITMNPGYAGRTELPDNLKALFRPVAMMVPNYTLIAEISLFSFGFSDAQDLAGKITTTFKLSSEQLSSQDHYDFGMRAVKTVIAVAGNLKREHPDMDERQIVLRSLRDVNVPKFLRDDLKLFNGIVSDLFPRMVMQEIDYGILEKSIRDNCIKMQLEDVDEYVMKVIQLYETTVVRHGLMLVGPTGSGKTKCYEILKDAMTELKGQPAPSGYPFEAVHTYVLNPKSITMGQLYGEFDLLTHEWTDGILPCMVREGVAADDSDKRWYVFDGPVDAVWIENMNTVLDDNKKLCLTSGEIITLLESMTMMFEVADLAVASPATVSRCGMVFLEPSVLGLQPFINCWAKRLPELAKDQEKAILDLYPKYLLPGLEFARSHLTEIVGSVDSALVMSFLGLMDIMLNPLTYPDGKPPPAPQFLKLIPDLLVPWVVFSLIWSIGATCDLPSRTKFSEWVRQRMAEEEHGPLFPKEGLVYDYRLHDGGFTTPTTDGEPAPPKWVHWMANVENIIITQETKYSDIEVPTIDNIRSAEVLGMLVHHETPTLCVGPTGTGKTVTIISKLSRRLHKKFICDFILFSARTQANQTQDLIDSKLDKRRKGVFGPPLLKRQVFFIDDLNMPALEVYGAQPPIELIRQWMDFKGWYDRKNIGEFRTIIDVNFVGAMGPPGGGRNPVTLRLLRHFHYLAFTEMETSSKLCIFGTIMKSWLDRTPGLQHLLDIIVNSTLSLYNIILKELLPTPAKTHYTFNLRDLSKVFQGILMADPESMVFKEQLLRLWYHECCRVFQDRLVNDQDREWFDKLLRSKIQNDFKTDPNKALGTGTILFGDFMDPTLDIRPYIQIDDMEKLSRVLDHYLEEYNHSSTKPMKLVLFLDAICHVCRISRIIRQPLGNALLLGMGGSGRQSLTRLATHMAEFVCFQIELSKNYGSTEWRDDIKQLMFKAGVYNRETVFLLSDNQIKSESFLEDMNNILNSGDVPNIYQIDELDQIYNAMKGIVTEMGLPSTKSNLFSAYVKIVRSNLHSVITMSPIGELFRARIRQFPALVNCCTIDWFSAWPDSALQSVALQFLDDIQDLDVDPTCLSGIVVTCQFMHQSVVDASEIYLQELSRHNYVTPTSYLELLASYTMLMTKKKGELVGNVQRLQSGLDKLLTTGEEVKVLQKSLEKMKPALETAQKNAITMLKSIGVDRRAAEENRQVVEKEELEAAKKALISSSIAEDAQRDLDEAMPALMAAENSLKALNKGDISEVRALKRPPIGVHLVMEAICIVKDVKPVKIPGGMPGEKVLDYWEPGRNLLQNPDQFLHSLMEFDKESITEAMIVKLKSYIENPNFQPQKIITVSKACTSLCMWVHAMYKYYFVNKAVAPKKAALKEAMDDLAKTEAILNAAKASMKECQDRLNTLEAELSKTEAERARLQEEMDVCEARMDRAVRLITGLADERERWVENVAQYKVSIFNLVGDILISAGAVAYLAPFTDRYRRGLLNEWLGVLKEGKVPHTPGCSPVTILGEAVMIRQWQLDGLPRDFLSTENAVLVTHSKRWPLFIDPQGQANRWIRNMGKEQNMAITKLSDKELLRTMESCIRFGKPMLIENVGVELDPALDPVLMRQTYRQAGQVVIKLGDAVVPYSDDFCLYITTRLPNPHYTPEVSIKVLLVNFTLVPSGLQDQLLALVVMEERADLEEARSAIIISSAQMKHDLKECEDRILYRLSAAEGSPVDDIDLITTLEASKATSDDIKVKVEAAERTQVDIDATRALYIPVANRGQILFFCVSDLANVDPMYQYSLEWFIKIFVGSMRNTEKTSEIDKRVESVNEYFTFSLYSNICRSLFEKHKLHFAFLLCARILMDAGEIDQHEWHFLLAGGSPLRDVKKPDGPWLSPRGWKEILSLENLPNFVPLVEDFSKRADQFSRIVNSSEPHRERLPAPWDKKINDFQYMLLLKCLRPDKVTNAMQDYLTKHLGERFVEPQTTDLQAMYAESGPAVPLVFVLSTGTDPAADLYKFADKLRMGKRMFVISLGQGQGPRAEHMLKTAVEIGNWVFFQNCHLSPSWMPALDHLVENITPESSHKDFRIWLTSTPSPHFPVSILQNGSKMTVEPPRGVKANLLRAYNNPVTEFADFMLSENEKVPTFKLLLFSLCLFHGVCLERRKFGPLGFNIPYEFTDGDLRICISQLHMFLVEYDIIPFKVLVYTAGQINYGGRVTDDWDRRCIMNLLQDYYKIEVVDENFIFDIEGVYHQLPTSKTLEEYVFYIRSLPINDDPELFGLHPNADISYAQSETYNCLATLLALQPRMVGGAASSQEEVTQNIAISINEDVPDLFNLDAIAEKYPVLYEESLNTVLVQEIIRFNKLLKIIHSSLKEILKALKGLVVMSQALESMGASLYTNRVPDMWSSKAYPSLKPLGPWVQDLKARIDFLNDWIANGIPPVFWISGFYFPQAFLTGTLQNYARKYIVSIDAISFGFKILEAAPKKRPADGCCIWGLFLEGARWSKETKMLAESRPKELYTDMPVVWLLPEENREPPSKGIYECPVYKTLTRAGTLSTTGHSTNYVVAIEVPSDKTQTHWIKRGVALICALNY